MTRTQLYTFVTGLLGGYQMDETLFNSFLDVAQMKLENLRPWVVLRAEDATQTVSPGNTFTTAKTLPANFRKWYSPYPIVLVDSNNNPNIYAEVPLGQKYLYRNSSGKFYTDYANSQFFICGNIPIAYTAHLYYIKKSDLVSEAADSTWSLFPTEYHKALGFDVALMQRLGVNYDLIEASNGNENARGLLATINAMETWDDDLQRSMTAGIDPFGSTAAGATAGGGNMNGW